MEVHHHSHAHGKKNWKSYFWEFLMLFLAVFCGFLAEYQLEHKIERDRSRQLIRSFYNDLHLNLASFEMIIRNNEVKTAAFHNIFSCYDTLSGKIANAACLLNMIKNSRAFYTVVFADGTLGQLKNAGGFRLLNKEDRDTIISYDNEMKNYADWESTAMQNTQNNVRDAFDMLGNFEINQALLADTLSLYPPPILINSDRITINRMFNLLFRYRELIKRQTTRMIGFTIKTNSLVKYFKEKYHYK